MAAPSVAGMATILSNLKLPDGVNPVVVNLPSPPALRGALRPNDWLTRAQAYALNLVNGPESLVVVNRYIYTGLKDGWVVEIKPNGQIRKILRMAIRTCGHPSASEDACGRPLGVRADRHGYLVVADAYNGIFRINPMTGNFRQLVDARNQVVNGKPLGYINDLAVARDDTIFFTSSSTKWKPSQLLNIIFEGETTGRVLVYNPREILAARRVQELVTNLHYPNGVQLSPDESYLLIGEGGRARIFRAWIGQKTQKFGTMETFAENLPGFVDNIRLSPRGTYWVGLSRARHSELPSVLDTYGDKPEVRGNLIALVNNKMIFDDPNFGIVVELNQDGKIVRSLQDPDGSKYTSVSEIAEEKGILFIASKSKNFIGIIELAKLPKPAPMDPATGTHVVDLSDIANKDLRHLLSAVKDMLQNLSEDQMKNIVLLLVRRLYEAKMEAKKAQDSVAKLRADLEKLQEFIGQSGISSGGAVSGGSTVGTTASGISITDSATTTVAPTAATTTTESVAIPPDMSGSPGLGGSVDGGLGVGETTQSSPGGTTPSAGSTTPAASAQWGTTPAAAQGGTTQAAAQGGTTLAATGSTASPT